MYNSAMKTCGLAIDALREISLTEEVIHPPSLFTENPWLCNFIPQQHLLIYHHYKERAIIEGEEMFNLRSDEIFLFFTGNSYHLAIPPEPYHSWAIHFPAVAGDICSEHIITDDTDSNVYFPMHLAVSNPLRISGFFAEIVQSWISGYPRKVINARGLFTALLTELPLLAREIETGHDARIDRVIEYLEFHLPEKVLVDALAERFNISRRTLLAKFKQQTGQTIISYQMSLRIRQAAMLLQTYPDRPLRVIADGLGFCDEFYFSKVFKRLMGYSPRCYQRSFYSTPSLT